jgi:hypothetical protein
MGASRFCPSSLMLDRCWAKDDREAFSGVATSFYFLEGRAKESRKMCSKMVPQNMVPPASELPSRRARGQAGLVLLTHQNF